MKGPPHMEKDKNGVNAACFDCCFHPEAISLCGKYKEFRDLVINTAIDGVEESYRKMNLTVLLDRAFHIVKGINYKQGMPHRHVITFSFVFIIMPNLQLFI